MRHARETRDEKRQQLWRTRDSGTDATNESTSLSGSRTHADIQLAVEVDDEDKVAGAAASSSLAAAVAASVAGAATAAPRLRCGLG